MTNNKHQLKQTPDPKKSTMKSKQFMLITEEPPSKNIKKSSEDDINSYFNYKE
jgi:hypothetical protein